MAQRFYHKASVQTAMVTGAVLSVITIVTILHQRSELNQENKHLRSLSKDQSEEIQRLETLLTPFRTIALDKFTGTDAEVLQQLAERIRTIDASLADAKKTIDSLKEELILKTSDRNLTQDQRQSLIQSLAGISGKVIVKADFADSEANMYANQIKSALAETRLEIVEQPSTGVVSVHEKGICLLVMDVQNLPSHAEAILKAFQQIDIDVKGRMSKSARFPEDAVLIWVCHR